MPPVIRIDDDVFQYLQKQAIPLVDTPNDVLRRLLALDKHPATTVSGNSFVDLPIGSIYTQRRWGLINVPKKARRFFPGYKVSFVLQTDVGDLTVRMTSASKGTSPGDPDAGAYIQNNLLPWYRAHPDLKEGDVLRIYSLEPGRRYKLDIVSK